MTSQRDGEYKSFITYDLSLSMNPSPISKPHSFYLIEVRLTKEQNVFFVLASQNFFVDCFIISLDLCYLCYIPSHSHTSDRDRCVSFSPGEVQGVLQETVKSEVP